VPYSIVEEKMIGKRPRDYFVVIALGFLLLSFFLDKKKKQKKSRQKRLHPFSAV
jgi:hypothetical protein